MAETIKAPEPRYAEMRKAAGMTQLEAAERTGISLRALCGYESGANQPTAARIYLMARAYGCSTDALLGIVKE